MPMYRVRFNRPITEAAAYEIMSAQVPPDAIYGTYDLDCLAVVKVEVPNDTWAALYPWLESDDRVHSYEGLPQAYPNRTDSPVDLSGDLPGLLQVDTPVTDMARQRRGFVTEIHANGDVTVAWIKPHMVYAIVRARDLLLDLTRPMVRACVSWWLAAKLGASSRYATTARWSWRKRGAPQWRLTALSDDVPDVWDFTIDVDFEDERRLPDGSRWVDAEALRLQCYITASVIQGQPQTETI